MNDDQLPHKNWKKNKNNDTYVHACCMGFTCRELCGDSNPRRAPLGPNLGPNQLKHSVRHST